VLLNNFGKVCEETSLVFDCMPKGLACALSGWLSDFRAEEYIVGQVDFLWILIMSLLSISYIPI